jgi:thymidine kinase
MLSTHDKVMIPCIQTTNLSDFGIVETMLESDVILINEGQFFEDLYNIVLNMVDVHKKIVGICALDGDFLRQRFGRVLDLIPHCDKVIKLHALCSLCRDGKAAIFSHRITNESEQIVIGSDNYMPLCRGCYMKKQIQ